MNLNKVLIIAEAGVNHNGDLEIAKKLIESAAEAGADYVKFQTFKADKLVSKSAKKAVYQQKNSSSSDDTQMSMLKKRPVNLLSSQYFLFKLLRLNFMLILHNSIY